MHASRAFVPRDPVLDYLIDAELHKLRISPFPSSPHVCRAPSPVSRDREFCFSPHMFDVLFEHAHARSRAPDRWIAVQGLAHKHASVPFLERFTLRSLRTLVGRASARLEVRRSCPHRHRAILLTVSCLSVHSCSCSLLCCL